MSEGQEVAERQDPEVVAIAVPARASASPPAAIIFIAALFLATLTLGSSIVLLTRAGPLAVADVDELDEVVRTAAPTRAAGTAAPAPVRAAAATGTMERLEAGTYRVIFLWTLEGARAGDRVLLRFSAGSRVLTEQRGTLDPNSGFTAATGRFAVATTQECSADGWSAELVTVRGAAAGGETTSRVPGVTCP